MKNDAHNVHHICVMGDKCRKLGRRWQVSLRETLNKLPRSLKEQALFSYSINTNIMKRLTFFL